MSDPPAWINSPRVPAVLVSLEHIRDLEVVSSLPHAPPRSRRGAWSTAVVERPVEARRVPISHAIPAALLDLPKSLLFVKAAPVVGRREIVDPKRRPIDFQPISHSRHRIMPIVHEVPVFPPTVVIVMGVSGSGKTTVGAMLAGRLHWHFADADDFHSAANVTKMHSGIPLDDHDRIPWLRAIADQIDRWRADKQHGVITCSALKRRYREIMIGSRPDVRLVYLKGEQTLIAHRLVARHGHFMPRSLLESQFAALEEPTPEERAISIWVGQRSAVLVDEIVAALAAETAIVRPGAPEPRK